MNSKLNKVVVYAFEKGYRVRKDGVAVNPKGGVIKGNIDSRGYKKFNIRLNGKETIPVYIHKLCAYQKYGDIVFQTDCVRHIDGNPLNTCPDNIEIGTSFVRKYNKNEVRDFYKQNGNSYKKNNEPFWYDKQKHVMVCFKQIKRHNGRQTCRKSSILDKLL